MSPEVGKSPVPEVLRSSTEYGRQETLVIESRLEGSWDDHCVNA